MLTTIGSSMNTRYLAIVAVITAMLVGATALSTTDNAFAEKKKYEKSQAASQVNECGNGILPENIFCQNLLSQIQGDGNAANVIGVQSQ
jgi:hypothetical protein